MVSKISETSFGMIPRDGSSSIRSFGCDISPRPIASCCCSPPESVSARCPLRSASRGKRARTVSSVSCVRCFESMAYAPMSRLSITESRPKSWRPSGTMAIPRRTMSYAGTAWRASPLKRISPDRSRRSPEIARRTVLFPAPLEPMRLTTSPLFTVKEMSWTARTPPL